jgi:predicted HD superfamily hydrolase involved in NAD metabolism
MLSESEILAFVESNLSTKRYAHTLRVLETAMRLASNLDVDLPALRIACISHDMTKEDSSWTKDKMYDLKIDDEQIINHPHVWHGFTAAYTLKNKFKIEDERILNAVRYHTISDPYFDLIGKILYIADYIEPFRKQTREFKISNMNDIDILLKNIVNEKIEYFEKKKFPYHKNILLLADALENT